MIRRKLVIVRTKIKTIVGNEIPISENNQYQHEDHGYIPPHNKEMDILWQQMNDLSQQIKILGRSQKRYTLEDNPYPFDRNIIIPPFS